MIYLTSLPTLKIVVQYSFSQLSRHLYPLWDSFSLGRNVLCFKGEWLPGVAGRGGGVTIVTGTKHEILYPAQSCLNLQETCSVLNSINPPRPFYKENDK